MLIHNVMLASKFLRVNILVACLKTDCELGFGITIEKHCFKRNQSPIELPFHLHSLDFFKYVKPTYLKKKKEEEIFFLNSPDMKQRKVTQR